MNGTSYQKAVTKVKVAFLQLAIPAGCKCYFNEVEKCLKQVGRMRYLRLLYTSLAKCSDEEKMLGPEDLLGSSRVLSPDSSWRCREHSIEE
jgi:hypothetical protein